MRSCLRRVVLKGRGEGEILQPATLPFIATLWRPPATQACYGAAWSAGFSSPATNCASPSLPLDSHSCDCPWFVTATIPQRTDSTSLKHNEAVSGHNLECADTFCAKWLSWGVASTEKGYFYCVPYFCVSFNVSHLRHPLSEWFMTILYKWNGCVKWSGKCHENGFGSLGFLIELVTWIIRN